MTPLNRWQQLLVGASATLMVLELVSAFVIEVPAAAITYVVLLGVGIVWLVRTRSRGAVGFLGVLHLLEVVLAISFLRLPAAETGGLALLVPVIATSVVGAVSALGTVRARGELRHAG